MKQRKVSHPQSSFEQYSLFDTTAVPTTSQEPAGPTAEATTPRPDTTSSSARRRRTPAPRAIPELATQEQPVVAVPTGPRFVDESNPEQVRVRQRLALALDQGALAVAKRQLGE